MTDQLLAELRKMRSTRTNLGLLAGMVGLILLTVLLNGLIPKPHELATHDNQHALLSAGTSAALFAALIGVMAITSEFRHGTIRPTFVVTPHRDPSHGSEGHHEPAHGRPVRPRCDRPLPRRRLRDPHHSRHPARAHDRPRHLALGRHAGHDGGSWPRSALASAPSCETRSSRSSASSSGRWSSTTSCVDSSRRSAATHRSAPALHSLPTPPTTSLQRPQRLLMIGYVGACVAGGAFAVARRDVT